MTAMDISGAPVNVGDWVTVVRACRGTQHCEEDIGLTFKVEHIYEGEMECRVGGMHILGWFFCHPKYPPEADVWIPALWCKKLDAEPDEVDTTTEEEMLCPSM